MSIGTKKSQYNFQAIETKWRSHWEQEKTYRTLGPGDPSFDNSKTQVLHPRYVSLSERRGVAHRPSQRVYRQRHLQPLQKNAGI